VENPVDGIFIKDTQIAVGVDVHLEGFQLKTISVGHVVQRDHPEVRQIGFWTDRRILGNLNRDFITLILIRERFYFRQWSGDAAFGMPFVVSQLRGFWVSSARFTFHASHLLHLFHPLRLTDLFQFDVEGDPGTFHLRVDFAKPTLAHTSTRAVGHELWTLGFE